MIKKTAEIGGKPLSIEVGRMARLAHGSAVVTLGETMVLATACEAEARPGIDFFPLTIDYREKTYAAGKIPGGFFKREGRPTNKEILSCRLIDRPIRPLFAERYQQEVQVLCNVLSYDGRHDPDVLAGIAGSMALMMSRIPLLGPVGWVRVGRINGELVIFPADSALEASDLDLVVAGTKDSVTMVEAGMNEVSEDVVLDAIALAHDAIKEICALQEEVMAAAGVRPAYETYVAPEDPVAELRDRIRRDYAAAIRERIVSPDKQERRRAVDSIRDQAVAALGDPDAEQRTPEGRWPVRAVKNAFREVADEVARALALERQRVDGRGLTDIRKITCEVGFLPRAHGSALFTRGETQALVSATLGTSLDEQVIDGLPDEYKKKFYLHYNFPPSSVGEVRPIRGTSRRETGHGALAERALEPVLPSPDEFPYTLRIVSDILMSNGSSSMASVCGGTLCMLDAGVKIRAPVAGIAMGLVKEGDDVVVLSDILGDEDHFGDMDFKVAGTREGITALQMDIKARGVSREVLRKALEQAREGRLHILDRMQEAISAPREDYSPYAPRLISIRINPEKIGTVIGPGGKVIRQIQEETGTTIEVVDDGTVKIFATDGENAARARKWIEDLTIEAEVGRIYEGPIVQMRDFGVFVQILPNQDGMIHVSELADGYVEHPSDVVKIGDVIRAKCIAVDPSGKVKLSRKALLREEGGGGEGEGGGDRGPREHRGPDRDRGDGRRGRDDRGGDRGGRGGRGRDRDRDDRGPRRRRGRAGSGSEGPRGGGSD